MEQEVTWSKEAAERAAVKITQSAQGLLDYMDRTRTKASRLISTIESMKSLTKLRTVRDFDRLSKRMQEVRVDVVNRDIVAEGAPWSIERIAQVKGLEGKYGEQEKLCSVPRGRRFGLSLNSQKGT